MHRLLEFLMANDIFMSFKPDVVFDEPETMVVKFGKYLCDDVPFWRSFKLSGVEINLLNIDSVDVLLDFAERFMKAFNEENAKRAAGSEDQTHGI